MSVFLTPSTSIAAPLARRSIDTAALDNRRVSHEALIPDADNLMIIARVHFEITILYGTGRFEDENEGGSIDVESAFFHLCRSAGLGHGKACITLARHFMNLNVDDVCPGVFSVLKGRGDDREQAQLLLERAVSDEDSISVAVGMLLKYFKEGVSDEDRIKYCELLLNGAGGDDRPSIEVGDKVQAAYGGGETWYEAEVREVGDAGERQ